MKRFIFALVLPVIVLAGCRSKVELKPDATTFSVNPMFGSDMVLQREMMVPVWGRGLPGEVIGLEINGKKYAVKVNRKGKWIMRLQPIPVGGPYTMKITGKVNTITFTNVMSGDVWICSGQSNMQWPVSRALNSDKEIDAAEYPNIRLFSVKRKVSPKLLDKLEGKWVECSPETVGSFSAVGYFFGRDLYQALKDVPIGLIHSSWGGTPAEAWTRKNCLNASPMFYAILQRHDEKIKAYPENLKIYKQALAEQKKSGKKYSPYHNDTGTRGLTGGWEDKDYCDRKWPTMDLPRLWEDVMNIDGVVWFRKTVDIPKDWTGKKLTLKLAMIDDFDRTYFNGKLVGKTGSENPDAWETPRVYTVPAKLVKPGKAVIAVRVFDRYGGGGIYGYGMKMSLTPADAESGIDLSGKWKYQVSLKLIPKTSGRLRPPYSDLDPHRPSGLYNAMINPIIPYAVKGAIWYQGESNAGRAYQYRYLMPAMIQCWRHNWGQGDFPFLIVELANFKKAIDYPVQSTWAELREAQNMTADKLDGVGVASAIDIGEAGNIHPKNKQDVGKRLCLAALKIAYGKDIVHAGPKYDSMEIDDHKIIVKFKNVGGGLVAKGGPLKRFAVAGKNQKFYWANAVIEGDTVQVSSPEVRHPVAVRYAWSDNPAGCNLYNKAGLPATPFRTDDWPGITYDRR